VLGIKLTGSPPIAVLVIAVVCATGTDDPIDPVAKFAAGMVMGAPSRLLPKNSGRRREIAQKWPGRPGPMFGVAVAVTAANMA
jgi:hypothetical protein